MYVPAWLIDVIYEQNPKLLELDLDNVVEEVIDSILFPSTYDMMFPLFMLMVSYCLSCFRFCCH